MDISQNAKVYFCNCGAVANKRCGKCKKVKYCSEKCQKEHWKVHKQSCLEIPVTTYAFNNYKPYIHATANQMYGFTRGSPLGVYQYDFSLKPGPYQNDRASYEKFMNEVHGPAKK